MGSQDFKINNGILEEYLGHDSKVIIPNGIEVVESVAFKNAH